MKNTCNCSSKNLNAGDKSARDNRRANYDGGGEGRGVHTANGDFSESAACHALSRKIKDNLRC